MIKNNLVKHLFVIAVLLFFSSVSIAGTEPTPRELEQEVVRYTALLLHDGGNAKYLNDLGFAYYRLHRVPEALTVFLKAVASDPACSTSYNNLGAAYLRLKEYGKAEDAFSKALAINPHFIKAAYNLSVALYRQKKYFAAYKAYQRAKEIDADYVKKRFDSSHAGEKLHEDVKNDPNNPYLQTIVKSADKGEAAR